MQTRFLGTAALSVLTLGLTIGLTMTLPVPPVSAQGARLSEPAGGFSYLPPKGWQIRTFPGMKYKICYAKPANHFAPNINVVDETSAIPMDRYMQMSLTAMKRVYTNLHSLKQTPFVTASGLHGIRESVNGTVQGKNMHQVFYVFSAPSNRKIVVTASSLAADGVKYDAATDGAMKTFRLQ